MLMFCVGIVHPNLCETVFGEFRSEWYMWNNLILHPTYVVDAQEEHPAVKTLLQYSVLQYFKVS